MIHNKYSKKGVIDLYYFHQNFERAHFGRIIFILSYELVHENVWYLKKVQKNSSYFGTL